MRQKEIANFRLSRSNASFEGQGQTLFRWWGQSLIISNATIRKEEVQMKDSSQNIKMTPEKVAKMLQDKRVDISVEDAAKVLSLLKKIARIAVIKYLGR